MHNFIKELREWLVILVTAFLVAFFLNNVIITNSFIPTPSMESNLPVGSRLFGFRLAYVFGKPRRGDVVIFDFGYECKNCGKMYQKNADNVCSYCKELDRPSFLWWGKNKKVHFIKRVVGLPGEHIEIKSDYTAEKELFHTADLPSGDYNIPCGHVYINGEKMEEDYINEPMIVNDFYHGIDLTIPEDCYFLLGDNRNNSEDARFWPIHYVSIKDVEAKAYIIYWPLPRIGLIK